MTPIAQAVETLKAPAVERAANQARERLYHIASNLLGSDLAVAAPYPKGTMGRQAYAQAQGFYHLARAIMQVKRESSRHGSPEHAVATNEAGIERLVNEAAEATAAAFDAYVAKLETKVGTCDSAEVVGMLWQGSTLTVRKGATVERWKTQQIVNVSVLGKVFNQWPTRLIK